MSEFDPYYHWLGIAPKDQPPNHYRLLGIETFEANADVISNAADRQMGHVRSYQGGKYASASQKILNEVAAARVCLLDPERKAAYDDRLRAGGAGQAGESVEEASAAFGEYNLIDHIASDAKGQIFKAQHRRMGRVVALKVLSSQATKSPEAVARFQRKTKILAQLSHPNLVAAYDAGERDDTHYLIMEYVDGCDLLELMKRHGTLPVRHVVDYLIQAATGLGFAHAHGIVHRNVKPSNLLVDTGGIVKVIGLGLALFRDEQSLSETVEQGRVLGTIDYMSLEQAIDSSRVDQRADIYSLGCTMYTALTRKLPFPVKSPKEKLLAHRDAPIPSIAAVRSDAPEILDQILQRMMAKRPEHRFQAMNDVVRALQMAEQVILSGAAPASAPPAAAAQPPETKTVVPPASGPGDLDSFLSNLATDEPHWKKRRS
jgi:serine/threonine-protein kinase